MAAKAKSASTTTEAGSGVGSRRTVSDAERDQTTTRLDQIVDTGADEANMSAILDQTRSWNAKVNRDYEIVSEALHKANVGAQDHLEDVRTIRLSMLKSMAENADFASKQYLETNKLGSDRMWNVNETDAFSVLLNKSVSDAIKEASGE